MALQIDTGSSDLWVNIPTSTFCKNGTNGCEAIGGTYNIKASSSFRFLSDDFAISYADNTGAMGDYALETFEIGSALPIIVWY